MSKNNIKIKTNGKKITHSKKKSIISKDEEESLNNNSKIASILSEKIFHFMEIIKRTIIQSKQYKKLDVYGVNEMNVAIEKLEELYVQLEDLNEPIEENSKFDKDQVINKLQDINNEISVIFKSFGTLNMKDLLDVCFGNEYVNDILECKNENNIDLKNKYTLVDKYVHPIGYKSMNWKSETRRGKESKNGKKNLLKKNRIVEDFMIIETSENIDCFDLARTSRSFPTKVYGIKIAFHNEKEKKTLIVCGMVDDVNLRCMMNYKFIKRRLTNLDENKPNDPDFTTTSFERFKNCLTLKELLIYNNDELYNRFMGYLNQIHLIKQRTISQIVKDFIACELYNQRTTLIQLLLKTDESEFQYLAYLLYDLLSNDTNGNIDTNDQTLLLDSLPWNVKKYFKNAMKETIQYTKNLSNFDTSKIPLEQQICLMKASDAVKEKAMIKLKEVKAKSEDSGSKARQYLEALLRIPFGIYKEEEILTVMEHGRVLFNDLVNKLNKTEFPIGENLFPIKEDYTSLEMKKYNSILQKKYLGQLRKKIIVKIKAFFEKEKRKTIVLYINKLNSILKKHNLKKDKLSFSGKKASFLKVKINEIIDKHSKDDSFIFDLCSTFNIHIDKFENNDTNNVISCIENRIMDIDMQMEKVNKYISYVPEILDKAVHGHKKAKRQIERIIGQWMNGEKTGYCFGFEGAPGIGKTSLAKHGIAQCLKDENGNSRPFAFIAIGGSSNGSTLDGHNYTYVGSTWGRIVDILMEKKCMNPIIFIDELDKVSRTEHGKEIIGILTHLIDSTQNDHFNDKYFNGIGLDLSKALFIFSYNDADLIDRILLDRIHRIRFKHLSTEDKLVITHKYILPEMFKKMGMNDVLEFDDDIIEYIINEYTYEPGVRKLKEILFEIIGEINISTLKEEISSSKLTLPLKITKDEIKYKYLQHRTPVNPKKIHKSPLVGTINGLWANALGRGGIIPIETRFFPSGTFLDLKLTGLQGDVMKESMNVAKTLAWSLLKKDKMKKLSEEMDKTKYQGIHIHCPEGAVPKDGPSAGAAITTALYSLFSKKKIKNNIGMTGEINLQGRVTAIGGLDLKILGGIRAGVNEFIYPKENEKQFKEFYDEYKDKPVLNGIKFHEVDTIQEVVKLVFV